MAYYRRYARRAKRTYGRRVGRGRRGIMRRGGVRRTSVAKLATKVRSIRRFLATKVKPKIHLYKNVGSDYANMGKIKFGTLGDTQNGVVKLSHGNGMIHVINMQDLSKSQAIFGPATGWQDSDRCVIKACKLRVRIDMNDPGSPFQDQRRVTYSAFHVKLRKRCDLTENGLLGSQLVSLQLTSTSSYNYYTGTGNGSFDWMNSSADNGTYWQRIGGRVILNPEYFEIVSYSTFEVGPSFANNPESSQHAGPIMGWKDHTEKVLYFQSKPTALRAATQPVAPATETFADATLNEVPSKNQFVLIFSDDDREGEKRQWITVQKEFIVAVP